MVFPFNLGSLDLKNTLLLKKASVIFTFNQPLQFPYQFYIQNILPNLDSMTVKSGMVEKA